MRAQGMINKRPNMNQYNRMVGNAGDQEDDDPAVSSFTKSKVDDDDGKFNSQDDEEFLKFLEKRKQEKSIPKPKPLENDPTTPQKSSVTSAFKTPETPSMPNITIPSPNTSKIPITPSPKQDIQQAKTPTAPNKEKATPVKPPAVKQSEPKPSPKTAEVKPAEVKPAQNTPVKPADVKPATVKNTPTKPQEVKPSPKPSPKPAEVKPVQAVQEKPKPQPVKPQPVKPSPVKPESIKTDEPEKAEKKIFREAKSVFVDQPKDVNVETPKSQIITPRFEKQILPQFVRKGKNSAQVLSIFKSIDQFRADERIRSIEPRNPKVQFNKNKLIKDTLQQYVLRSHPDFYGQQKDQYSDGIFPGNISAIYQLPWKAQQSEQYNFVRSKDLYSDRQTEPLSVVDPNDIQPGQFKTQNLLSALSCLAEQPLTISRLLEHQQQNEAGFYYVRLSVDGVWRYTIVDDVFVVAEDKMITSGPAQDARSKKLSKTNPGYKNELWVALIEKAISKIFGSYEDIEQSTVKDNMQMLTGAPTRYIDFTQLAANELQQTLTTLNPNSLVTFILDNKDQYAQFKEKLNGFPQYGYSLLSYDNAKKEVKMRNAWGWLKEPSTKKDGVAKQIGNEGEFILSLSDLAQYFDGAVICEYRPDYWTISQGVRQLPNAYCAYSIEVKEQTNFFITYNQLDKRHFRNNLKEKYEYSFARILVFDEADQLVASNQGDLQSVSVELNQPAGKYIVILCVDWKQFNKENECPIDSTLVYYGANDCKFERVSYKKQPNLFAECGELQAISLGDKKSFPTNSPSFNKNITEYQWVGEDEKLVIISWQNSSDQAIKYVRDLKTLSDKSLLMPLCFVNSKKIEKAMKLGCNKMIQKRKNCWYEATELDIDFPPKSIYSIVFKPVDNLQFPCDKQLLKRVGLN